MILQFNNFTPSYTAKRTFKCTDSMVETVMCTSMIPAGILIVAEKMETK